MRRLILGIVVAAATLIPNFAKADDHAIARHIMSKLQLEQQRGSLKGFHVDMRVDQGTVWYKGFVANQTQKDLILGTAQQAQSLGVVQVVDDIEIKSSQMEAPQMAMTPETGMPQANQPQMNVPSSQCMPAECSNEVAMQGTPMAMNASSNMPTGVDMANRQTTYYQEAWSPQANQPQMNIPSPQYLPAEYRQNVGVQGPPMAMNAGSNMPTGGDSANLPAYAWPTYAAHPNYAAVTYPGQYSASAWPYIGPFYPYPQVPLGWRKVTMEWDDGWWWLDFNNR